MLSLHYKILLFTQNKGQKPLKCFTNSALVYFVFLCLYVYAYVNHSSGHLLPHPDGAGNKQGYAVGPLNRTV